jgi:hypothetical protein
MVITQPRFLSRYLFVNLSISPFVYLIISSHLSPIQFSFKKVKSNHPKYVLNLDIIIYHYLSIQ